MEEIAWTVDHLDDLDADFLALYGIDLSTDDITGPRFFARARRTFAYQGVMRARWEQEQEKAQPRPVSPSHTSHSAPDRPGVEVVDFDQFTNMFPDLISHAESR